MCWSEEISFTSGVALIGAGIITIRDAGRYDKSAMLLSIFPVLFGLHQISEGLIWHFRATGQDLSTLSHVYIYIAFLLWPVTVPIASIQAEKLKQRRLLLIIPALTGIFVTVYSAFQLWHSNGIAVSMIGHSLCYEVQFEDKPGLWLNYLYAFSVVAPLLFNSRKMVKVFGISVLASFALTFFMLREVYFSVWCLMCAWLTLMIYFTIERANSKKIWFKTA